MSRYLPPTGDDLPPRRSAPRPSQLVWLLLGVVLVLGFVFALFALKHPAG